VEDADRCSEKVLGRRDALAVRCTSTSFAAARMLFESSIPFR
jgi:hypothetical protein